MDKGQNDTLSKISYRMIELSAQVYVNICQACGRACTLARFTGYTACTIPSPSPASRRRHKNKRHKEATAAAILSYIAQSGNRCKAAQAGHGRQASTPQRKALHRAKLIRIDASEQGIEGGTGGIGDGTRTNSHPHCVPCFRIPYCSHTNYSEFLQKYPTIFF